MKRYGIFALVVVLCCTLFAGCRRGNSNMGTVSPTNEATAEMPTMPTMIPQTQPATQPAATVPTERETTGVTDGTEDTTGTDDAATDAAEGSRGRSMTRRPAAR